MEGVDMKRELWRGRRVLLTGHTGFKGAWLGLWLAEAGAEVTGLSLPAHDGPTISGMLGTDHLAASHLVDLRDAEGVHGVVAAARPEVVLHLAAQPLVRRSFNDPAETFGANVMGTVHLLEALRGQEDVKAIVVVTSDKVYENDESGTPLAEDAPLGGHDPYSASKGAAELVARSYRESFFRPKGVPLVTARGGNVVGGGDFAEDRIIPDVVRAAGYGEALVLRHPKATRPWQHVLDCVAGYVAYAEALLEGHEVPTALNFGPRIDLRPVPVAELAGAVQSAMGIPTDWTLDTGENPPEKAALSIDPALAAKTLGVEALLGPDDIVSWTAEWYGAWMNGADMRARTREQIARYEELMA